MADTDHTDNGAVEPRRSPGSPSDAAPAERNPALGRRRHERHLFERLVVVTEIDVIGNPSATWECRVVDLSRGGIGLRSRRMVHNGRGVFVELRELNGVPPRILFGYVRQLRYAEGEGYVVGVQLAPAPQSTVIRQWLAEKKRAAAKPAPAEGVP